MQIVGRGRQRVLGDTIILSNPSGGLAHVSARNLAICVARALQEGWREERLEAFIATIRVE